MDDERKLRDRENQSIYMTVPVEVSYQYSRFLAKCIALIEDDQMILN